MITGTTPSHTLVMRLATPDDREALGALIREWQAPYMKSMPDTDAVSAMCLKKADKHIAANEFYTDEIDANTGFVATFVATVEGVVVGWERCKVTMNTSFVLRLAVFEAEQENGYFTTLRECGEYLCFDHLGLQGVIWEVAQWAGVMGSETSKHGYSVIETKRYDESVVDVVGYTAEHYTQTMKPKQKSAPRVA